jgi:aldose 1-epimerase
MKHTTETPLPDTIRLSAHGLCVELAPQVGGSIARFHGMRDGVVYDWLRPATAEAILRRDAEGMASFPLIPFCNRIRNGRASFRDQEIVLPPNRGGSPHAIHGSAWQQPWSVLAADDSSARLQLDAPRGAWPYHFRATQQFELQAGRLAVRMEVENRDSVPMPIGIGHHPYFPHLPGTRLTASVSEMWLSDDEVMPTVLGRPPFLEALRQGVLLSDLVLDNNFIGWNRQARVDWPAGEGRPGRSALTLQAQAPLDFFVLYSPARADHFCMEPVSNCTDWLNLTHYRQEQRGGAELAPGGVLTANFALLPEWID